MCIWLTALARACFWIGIMLTLPSCLRQFNLTLWYVVKHFPSQLFWFRFLQASKGYNLCLALKPQGGRGLQEASRRVALAILPTPSFLCYWTMGCPIQCVVKIPSCTIVTPNVSAFCCSGKFLCFCFGKRLGQHWTHTPFSLSFPTIKQNCTLVLIEVIDCCQASFLGACSNRFNFSCTASGFCFGKRLGQHYTHNSLEVAFPYA